MYVFIHLGELPRAYHPQCPWNTLLNREDMVPALNNDFTYWDKVEKELCISPNSLCQISDHKLNTSQEERETAFSLRTPWILSLLSNSAVPYPQHSGLCLNHIIKYQFTWNHQFNKSNFLLFWLRAFFSNHIYKCLLNALNRSPFISSNSHIQSTL